jgi:hypothetical protein
MLFLYSKRLHEQKILQRLIPSQIPDRFSKLLSSMSVSVPLTSFFNDVKICVASYFISHEEKYCTKFLNQYSFICSKFYELYTLYSKRLHEQKILQRLIPSQIPDRFSKLLSSTAVP